MHIISTTIGRRLVAVTALALGLGYGGLSNGIAPANAVPAGPGGLTTCIDLDENGQPQCDHGDDEGGGGFDGPDGFETPPADPDPEPPVDPEIPDAPVDDPVVAEPTFTG